MKILINRSPIYDQPWGGGNNFVKAFVEQGRLRGHEIVYRLEPELDCIFMQDPRPSDLGISALEIIDYKKKNPRTVVVHRVNECDARKGTFDMDQMLRYWSQGTDITFFVSEWIKRYFGIPGWGCENQHVLHNGVDGGIFKANNKLGNGKVNIVTHHWSSNPMKGFDIYRMLDEFVGKNSDFTFTYMGRDDGTLPNTKIVQPLFGKELGEELGKYDIYISASRFDPGPNHILEALSCGLPTYAHIDGGGCLEMVGNDHVYSTFEELMSFILGGGVKKNSGFQLKSWEECMDKCIEIIEGFNFND